MLLIPGIAPHINVDHHHVGDYDHDQWWWLWSSSDIVPHIYVDHIPNIIIVLLLVPIVFQWWLSWFSFHWPARPLLYVMSENLKPADNIIPDQVEQNTCPAHFCCTHPPTVSDSFAPRSYKTCIHCENMCWGAGSNWNPTHHSWQSIFRARKQIVHRETFSSAQSRCLDFP